jgi:transcriptional regulator with XRE-family HTH domain
MLDKDNTLEYNHKILSQEREKQKISQENAAAQLTLSVGQIKSLENDLNNGFVTPHFKNLALKRYAKFLEIDFYKIISEPDNQKKITTDFAPKEEGLDVVTQNTILLQLSKLKTKKMGAILGLIVLSFPLFFLFFQADDNKISTPEVSTTYNPNVNVATPVINDSTPVNNDFMLNEKLDVVPKSDVQEIENISDIVSIEFICSIESASMDKVWSRVNPEKPATYFHIVSLKKQTICTIDNQGVVKQYDLDEGAKITHRGEAPFKIQLDSSVSELYFQGWKVYLKDNDNFIQLNPVDMPTELN